MQAFVVEFNRRTRGRRVHQFSTLSEAMKRRFELEEARVDSDIEIAALTSVSIASLQRTHSRYFTGVDLDKGAVPA